MNTTPFIHILWNDLSQVENCPLCGHLHNDAMIGLWPFVSGLKREPQRICWSCGEDLAHELLEIVLDFNQNEKKLESGLYRKMFKERFDELFEGFKYFTVELTELTPAMIEAALIDEVREILYGR